MSSCDMPPVTGFYAELTGAVMTLRGGGEYVLTGDVYRKHSGGCSGYWSTDWCFLCTSGDGAFLLWYTESAQGDVWSLVTLPGGSIPELRQGDETVWRRHLNQVKNMQNVGLARAGGETVRFLTQSSQIAFPREAFRSAEITEDVPPGP